MQKKTYLSQYQEAHKKLVQLNEIEEEIHQLSLARRALKEWFYRNELPLIDGITDAYIFPESIEQKLKQLDIQAKENAKSIKPDIDNPTQFT